jgi:hypothetical protein
MAAAGANFHWLDAGMCGDGFGNAAFGSDSKVGSRGFSF